MKTARLRVRRGTGHEPARYDDSGRAVSEANVASGLIIGGAALALAGFVLWLAHPGDTTRGTAHARALPLEGAK